MAGPPPEKITVWTYFFVGLPMAAVAVYLIVTSTMVAIPSKSTLVHVQGDVKTVIVRDDISKTTAGSVWPMLTSVYFTLEGVEGEFRYPYFFPDYFQVRDATGWHVDLWVDARKPSPGNAPMIWQIQETGPQDVTYPETSISYKKISGFYRAKVQANLRLGRWLGLMAAVLLMTGQILRRVNRRRLADAAR